MDKEFSQLQWGAELEDDCRHLIRLAVREDLDRGYDWTTVALVPESRPARARLVAREAGIVAGLATIPIVLEQMDVPVEWSSEVADGADVSPTSNLGTLFGPARDLLTSERLLLNLVGRLSGIATLTRHYVQCVTETSARIYDTRKTCPGYRRLEKYAVRCGGGNNHRTGLFDAILIKDNHLAFGRTDAKRRYSPAEAVQAARQFVEQTLPESVARSMIIEIEVDTLTQLRDVLPTHPDIVLLDNMTPEMLRAAVDMRNNGHLETELEASGGVNLETVRQIAMTGVDRISVGALTHSARCLDIGLDWMDD